MKFLVLFILSYGLWLIFTWNSGIQNLTAGFVVSLLTVILFGRDFPYKKKKFFQVERYFYFLVYLFVFTGTMIKANFIMAYRVLSPRLPIKPAIVKVPIGIKSPLGRIILANSITLTPGTLTVEIEEDALYIHWIHLESRNTEKTRKAICGTFGKLLKRVFE
jgi:multicomponent Na+:H+ antiporter subunit E